MYHIQLILVVLLSACHPSMSTSFNWLPTTSAPSGYPIVVIDGQFQQSTGDRVSLPAGSIVANGWGNAGTTILAGKPRKEIPDSLSVLWFSFAEDKFYEASVRLPKKIIEGLFKTGFGDPQSGQHTTFSEIVVGMAPGGTLSVWLRGGGGISTRILLATAKTKEAVWELVLDNPDISRSDYIKTILKDFSSPSALAYIRTRPDNSQWWMHAAKQYEFVTTVIGALTVESLWIDYVDGETEFALAGLPIDPRPRAIPIRFLVRWISANGDRYSESFEQNVDEAINAAKELSTRDDGNTLQVVLDVSRGLASTRCSIRSTRHVIALAVRLVE